MKVLFITHCTTMYGANRSMLQLILELRDYYGIESFVIVPPDNSSKCSLKNYLQAENINFKEFNVPFFKQQSITRSARFYYIYCFHQLSNLCEELRSIHFDIVHSNSSCIDFGGYISRTLGIKHVWHLRDFGDLDYDLHCLWGTLYEITTYRNADSFIAISNVIKNHFSKIIDKNKIHIIYNGIKPNKDVPLATHKNECVQFLCAGIVHPSKNQREIVQAVDLLINERKITKLHLTIVGRCNREYVEEIKLFMIKHNISEYITFVDEIDGIEDLASTMDVGIMSSRCEAFGRVTVEYMFQNLAVIANDNGANEEIITDGKTGLIYQHDSVEALANKMQTLIEDRNLLVSLAIAAREEAKKRFLSTINTKHVYEIYKEMTSTKSLTPNRLNNLCSARILMLLHLKDIVARKIKG